MQSEQTNRRILHLKDYHSDNDEIIRLEDFSKEKKDIIERGKQGYYVQDYARHFRIDSFVVLKRDLVSAFQEAVEEHSNSEKNPFDEYYMRLKVERTLLGFESKQSRKEPTAEQKKKNYDEINEKFIFCFLDLWKLHCRLIRRTGKGLEGNMSQEKILSALKNATKDQPVRSRKEDEFDPEVGFKCFRWRFSLGPVTIVLPKTASCPKDHLSRGY